MNLKEYEKVKGFNYLEYCDYLQSKYGVGLCDYMTKSYNRNSKVSRTKDGLVAHHKFEDHAIMLSTQEYAQNNPFEWQLAKNIVYCDYLEHMLLHILICEHPAIDKNENEIVGVGGIVNHIVPELNDFYSGFRVKRDWMAKCYSMVENDYDVYLALIERYINWARNDPNFKIDELLTSYNEQFGYWFKDNNDDVFFDIKEIYYGDVD